MTTPEGPPTRATSAVAALGMPHEVVRYGAVGSVEEAACARGVPLGAVVKTLVVRRGDDDLVLVLVPGDRAIDWKKLRDHLGVRRAALADREEAIAGTGYEPGTITPFGTIRRWPVVADRTLAERELVSIGGGARGVAIQLHPAALIAALEASVADVTRPRAPSRVEPADPTRRR